MTTRLDALDRAVQKLQHALDDVNDAASHVIDLPGPTPSQIAHLAGILEGVIELVVGDRRQEARRLELEGK